MDKLIVDRAGALLAIQKTIAIHQAIVDAAQAELEDAKQQARDIEAGDASLWYIQEQSRAYHYESWPIAITPVERIIVKVRPRGSNTKWRDVEVVVGGFPFYLVGNEKRYLYGRVGSVQQPVKGLYRAEDGRIVVTFRDEGRFDTHIYEEVD